MLRLGSVALAVTIGTIAVVGCGSDSGSEFGSSGGNGTSSGASSGGFTNGTSSSGAGASSSGTGVDTVGNVNANDACATSNAGATLPPVSLVFMIDRSGSMGNGGQGQNLAVRWTPVVSGLKSFFSDAASSNLSGSLAFFPIPDGNDSECTTSFYQTPVVAMTTLPNTTAFATALDGTGPAGGTPTEPALKGALDYARTIKGQGKNVAVVLATDGQPNDCSSDVTGVGNIAQAGAGEGIKTYVIGVGPSTGNLDSIAAKGGSTSAIMIPTNNPSQVSADLIKALGGIAASLLGCTYTLPNPPAGQTLDISKVNVNYTPANGALQTLPYSADCSNKGGWHYDNTAAPKEILLCDEMCQTAKSSAGAKLDVIFGCKTAAKPGEEPK